jgi:hypothetical protein
MNTTDRQPVTITELATRTGMHRNTIVRDIGNGKDGLLPASRISGQWVVHPDDADAYTEARSMVLRGEKALAGLREQAARRAAARAPKGISQP